MTNDSGCRRKVLYKESFGGYILYEKCLKKSKAVLFGEKINKSRHNNCHQRLESIQMSALLKKKLV